MRKVLSRLPVRLALLLLGGLLLAALAASWIAPADPLAQGDLATGIWQPPSAAHWLGTDSAARDVLSRMLHGARASLGIACLAVLVSLSLGTLVGATAAVARGAVDVLLMRFTDAMLAFPRLLLLLLVVAGVGHPGNAAFAVLLGATGWMMTCRLVRQETRRLLATEHVRGARALGVPWPRLVRRHILPGLAPTLAAAATFAFATAVPLEAGLSYLGLGVVDPAPSWGNILGEAGSRPLQHWWLIVFPTLAIAVTVVAANTIAEALGRDARDDDSEGQAGEGAAGTPSWTSTAPVR